MSNIELNVGTYLILGIISFSITAGVLYGLYKIFTISFIAATEGINSGGEYIGIGNGLLLWGILWALVALIYFIYIFFGDESKIVLMFTNSIIAGIISLIFPLIYLFIKKD